MKSDLQGVAKWMHGSMGVNTTIVIETGFVDWLTRRKKGWTRSRIGPEGKRKRDKKKKKVRSC